MPVVRITSTYVDGDHRVGSDWSAETLAERLEMVTGIPPAFQRLEITTDAGAAAGELAPSSTLGELGVADGWQIHVRDSRPKEEQLDLSADAAKPGMSYEEYSQRQGTLLQWKRENHLGRFGASQSPAAGAAPGDSAELAVPVGDECFVRLSSGKTVRGTVAFHGPVRVLPPGPWVGVRLASGDGLNDGTVKGVRLFDAEPNHGIVVRASAIRPIDLDEEEL